MVFKDCISNLLQIKPQKRSFTDLSSRILVGCLMRGKWKTQVPVGQLLSIYKHTLTTKWSNQSEGRIGLLHQLIFKTVKGRDQMTLSCFENVMLLLRIADTTLKVVVWQEVLVNNSRRPCKQWHQIFVVKTVVFSMKEMQSQVKKPFSALKKKPADHHMMYS